MSTASHIKQFWESQGEKHGESHYASWGDHFAIALEVEAIAPFIRAGQSVLDVGCSNGHALFQQYNRQPKARFTGVDYAETMILHAQKALEQRKLPQDQVKFSVGSVLELPFDDAQFDVAYTTRVLINLPTWEEQLQGLEECLRVTKKGGTVVISEGFWEPLCLLNGLRQMLGLKPLEEHDFNRYLKKSRLEAWLKKNNFAFEVNDFSSVYYFGSRVLRELIDKDPKPWGDYSSPVNKAFFELEQNYSGGGMGVQQAYVITR